VLLCATHNHAGPAGLRAGLFSRLDEPLARALVDQIMSALTQALAARRPATLKLGEAALDTISMNRRHPDWPIDPLLRVLLVDGEDGPIATLLNFACHATVMTGANLMLSAEFPGAACHLLQEQTGVPALYIQGACGNVSPVWIRQDFESVQRVGQIIGGQALRVVGELRTLGPGQRAHNIRWDEFPEKAVPGRIVESRLNAVCRGIDVPLRAFDADEAYAERTQELGATVARLVEDSDARREAMARLTRAQNERWAATWARRQPRTSLQRTEVQALSLAKGWRSSRSPASSLWRPRR